MTVTAATRTEQRVEDLPASVSVVREARIAETPGLAVDDVLRTLPSMDLGRVASYAQHPTSNNPSMRGLLSGVTSRMLVMVDGVPINDAFSGFVQWSRVAGRSREADRDRARRRLDGVGHLRHQRRHQYHHARAS